MRENKIGQKKPSTLSTANAAIAPTLACAHIILRARQSIFIITLKGL